MSHRYRSAQRALFAALLVISLVFTLPGLPMAQTPARSTVRLPAASAVTDDGHTRKTLTREQRTREAWVWHEANKRYLEQTHPLGAAALTTDIPSQDINDVAIIQGDNRLITPPNPFDLNGRAVQFTPTGGGYTITTTNGTFDTNFGTKLNLTIPPAVIPRSEPGDDSYIFQDFGFNFNYFGASYASVAISSNGNLTFRPTSVSQRAFDLGTVSVPESLAEFQEGLPRIAPFWHDLDARASETPGATGIYFRRTNDRVLITYNNIRDFPEEPSAPRGINRFQVTLFNDGRIVFTYDSVQLTSQALVGISPGLSTIPPTLIDLRNSPSDTFNAAVAEFFSTATRIDELGAIQAFYATHPNNDVYDFVYLITDFTYEVSTSGTAFAQYLPLRNNITGIGQDISDSGIAQTLGSRRLQGVLKLSNFDTQTGPYPESPTDRIPGVGGANHALSVMGQEQGHRWLTFTKYPGDNLLLLGRDDAHWSFFLHTESTISHPAAPRASCMEGNVWRDNRDGSFTSIGLNDGYSRLDHYVMGLRPPNEVPDTFVLTNLSGTGGRTREDDTFPNVIVRGTRQTVTVNEVIQANNPRVPNAANSQKNFRAAIVLLVRQGQLPTQTALNRVALYRLAWESYFAQSTDFLATIFTGLGEPTVSRVIAAVSAASYKPTLAQGEIAALFGTAITGSTAVATSLPLPTTLAGVEVRINGVPAPLFFASPTQINFQVPRQTMATTPRFRVSSATALIEVYRDDQLIRAGAFQIAPVVPALFTLNSSGTGAAAAVDALTGAPGPFNAKQSNGQPNIISVFGTGFGADVTDVDGNVSSSVQATIGGQPATVNYAGRAPGFVGLNQLNITLPADIAPGTYTLVISRNGVPSREVTITVQ